MRFALENGVDAIGQSFVNTARDVEDVRAAAQDMGFDPFIIAKSAATPQRLIVPAQSQ